MGDVGAVATAVDTVASWFMSAGGYAAWKKRRALKAKKEECAKALKEDRWDDLRRLSAELERLSDAA